MTKRFISLLLVCLLMVPVFATAEEPVTLRFMWWGSDSRHEATIAVCEQYMAAHPNVTIEFEYGGYDGYQEKLTTQLASGTNPDIIQFDIKWMDDILQLGDVFADLHQYEDVLDLSTFDKSMLDNYGYNGEQLVGLPTGANATSFLVNTAVTDAAGIDISAIKTWDDMIAAGEKLQAYNPAMYLLNVEVMNLGETFGYMIMSQILGDNLIAEDGVTLNATAEDFQKMFELYVRFYESGVLEPADASILYNTNPWTNPKWINHEYAMGYFATAYINASSYDFQDTSAVIAMPTFEDAKESGVMLVPAQLIGVAANCKNTEVAVDFLNFFYNDAEAAKVLGTCRSIPVTSVARQACADAGLVDPNINTAIDFAAATATAHQNTNVPTTVADILQDAAEKVAYGLGEPAAVAQETYDAVVAQLEYLSE